VPESASYVLKIGPGSDTAGVPLGAGASLRRAARQGAVDLTLPDDAGRLGARNTDFGDVPVRLVGFVMPEPGVSDGFSPTRFQIACCAADARPTKAALRGLQGSVPRRDTWVEVSGRFDPEQPTAAVILAESLRVVPEPRDPYE